MIALFLEKSLEFKIKDLESNACSGTISSTLILAEQFSHSAEIYIYHRGEYSWDEGNIKVRSYTDGQDLANNVNSKKFQCLIAVGNTYRFFCENIFLAKERVYWSHNHVNIRKLSKYIKNKNITKVVSVSKYQLGMAALSGVYKHCTYIYNPYLVNNITSEVVDTSSPTINIAFVGALVEAKGLGNVLFIVKKLSDLGIDVKLNIYGNSGLYGDDVETGKLEHLDLKLEKKWGYLLFDNNKLKNNITFHGLIGKDKLINELSKNDIFISGVNVVGAAECFSISFLDAQLAGLKVITLDRGGQKESLASKNTGVAFKSLEHVIEYVNTMDKRTLNKNKIRNEAISFIDRELSPKDICIEWQSLIGTKPKYTKKHLLGLVFLANKAMGLVFNKIFNKRMIDY